MTKLKEVLEKIAEVLYMDKVDEGLQMMSSVIPDLSVFIQRIESEEERQRFLNNVLVPALQAMEKRDAIMLADIITYEIIELIND